MSSRLLRRLKVGTPASVTGIRNDPVFIAFSLRMVVKGFEDEGENERFGVIRIGCWSDSLCVR